MIKPLKTYQAIHVIKEFKTEGHRPLLVLIDDYETTFIAKCGTGRKNPEFYLINEILAHYFLNCWNVPTPEIGLLKVGDGLINNTHSERYKNLNYKGFWFGSKFIENATEINEFSKVQRKADLNRIYNPKDLFSIALFDIWIENDDRKPTNTNLLFTPSEGRFLITAIDHCFTFASLSYKDLPIGEVSISFNDTILFSTLGKAIMKNNKPNKAFIENIQENFYLCIQRCENCYEQITNNVPKSLGFDDQSKEKVHDFLFNTGRNKKVFQDFLTKIKAK